MVIYNYIITYKIEYKVLDTFKHNQLNVNGNPTFDTLVCRNK